MAGPQQQQWDQEKPGQTPGVDGGAGKGSAGPGLTLGPPRPAALLPLMPCLLLLSEVTFWWLGWGRGAQCRRPAPAVEERGLAAAAR